LLIATTTDAIPLENSMPSVAIPAAVVAAVPSAAITQSGQSAGNTVPGANAAATGADAAGAGNFAALLERQMVDSLPMADSGAVLPIAGATERDPMSVDPATQSVDLSALLQGLMLPMAATPQGAPASDSSSTAAAAAPGGRVPQLSLAAPLAAGVAAQSVTDAGSGTPASAGAVPRFADAVDQDCHDASKAAVDAVVAGNAAEPAARELPVQPESFDMQSAAHLVTHGRTESPRADAERLVVSTPATAPNWHEDLGNKVSMLVGKEASSAELIFTPPHLGRVEVQLSVSGDQTTATFVAATPAAREALEQALPKLREFLAESGINLASASVGGDAMAGQEHAGGNHGGRSARGGSGDAVTEVTPAAAAFRRIDGMVDTFA
jgi:flagellar hook-length control protein FliK